METIAPHLQEKNAGNLGDLLKHYWLIELTRNILLRRSPSRIAYVESHAGSGSYNLTPRRVVEIARDKKRACFDGVEWGLFDRLNPRIDQHLYGGSFVLALRLLGLWKVFHREFTFRALLWEKDHTLHPRIRNSCLRFLPPDLISVRSECSAPEFISAAKYYIREGWTVLWLSDPYWGNSRKHDQQWFQLLDDKCGYGVLFTFLGGDSHRRGEEIFDYVKALQARRVPDKRADKGIRSYGLYLTTEAHQLLDGVGKE